AGMAAGGLMGGAIYDLTGSYTNAFLAGFSFNLMNLAIVAFLYTRQRRISLQGAVA
ncbi:MAG: MFS transporter, partial [Rhodospirillaceae bacterium]|nr:MFS transporter [Rhodospirillaceae bacterium]